MNKAKMNFDHEVTHKLLCY